MKSKTLILLSAFVFLSASDLVMAKESKIALVIGNIKYAKTPLKNSVNDAKDMKAALEKVGFSVIYAENATREKMDEVKRKFATALTKSSLGLFYYSGHGAQADGVNYLIPIDADITTKTELKNRAYSVDEILGEMEAAENPVNIVILDACRDNPFKGIKSVSSGLANSDAPNSGQGSLIAYATAPNDVADDNQKGRNGLYTKYLKQYLFTPGLTIENALKKVRQAVVKENPDQIPWENTSLINDICLAGCTSPVITPSPVVATNPPLLSFVSGNSSVEKNKTYTVNFKATDKDKDLSQIQIDWLDGSDITIKNAVDGTTLSFTHNYAFTGIYGLIATALDKVGNASNSVTKSVTVTTPTVVVLKIPSVSSISLSNSTITQGDSLTFSANLSSTLPAGYFVKVNYGNGLISMTGSGTNFSLTATPLNSAVYSIGIYDTKNTLKSNSQTGNFSVSEPNSAPTLSFISGNTSVTTNTNYSVQLQAADSDNNLDSIFIDWGDGASDSKAASNYNTLTFSHSYTSANTYSWSATAYDSDSLESNAVSKSVTVSKPVVIVPPANNSSTGTGKLNDTGITTCSDSSNNGLACPISDYPNQDAQSGRDVAKNDDSDGHAGFSFTKISSTGATLSASATDWNCVKDNVTSLIWEIKTTDGGLHDWNHTYSWYEPDSKKNGGGAGTQNGGSCKGSDCDTNAYVKAVNAAGYCGYKDWRLPTVEELLSIVNLDTYYPAIDSNYFPNTQSNWFWSSSPNANVSGYAWIVSFYYGNSSGNYKDSSSNVRLVRG